VFTDISTLCRVKGRLPRDKQNVTSHSQIMTAVVLFWHPKPPALLSWVFVCNDVL